MKLLTFAHGIASTASLQDEIKRAVLIALGGVIVGSLMVGLWLRWRRRVIR